VKLKDLRWKSQIADVVKFEV